MHTTTAQEFSLRSRYLGASNSGSPDIDNIRFVDAQEQACALSGWNQDYLQLSAGAFEGEICQMQGLGVKLFIERVQQSLFQTGVLPRDVLAVGIPLDASGAAMFCGQPCGTDVFHVFSGSSGFEFRTSRQHTMLGIELKLGQGWLSPTQGLEGVTARDLPAQAGALPMRQGALGELKTYLLALLQTARLKPEVLSSPAVVATVADFLLDRIAHARADTPACEARSTHLRLVKHACARVQETLENAPTVAQLCVDLGVSRRTLQNGFLGVLGVSPLAYLKAVRLGQARRALKRVSSVTEAATAYGFWHFGHFAQDYQAMFGELPSQTLRRHSGA